MTRRHGNFLYIARDSVFAVLYRWRNILCPRQQALNQIWRRLLIVFSLSLSVAAMESPTLAVRHVSARFVFLFGNVGAYVGIHRSLGTLKDEEVGGLADSWLGLVVPSFVSGILAFILYVHPFLSKIISGELFPVFVPDTGVKAAESCDMLRGVHDSGVSRTTQSYSLELCGWLQSEVCSRHNQLNQDQDLAPCIRERDRPEAGLPLFERYAGRKPKMTIVTAGWIKSERIHQFLPAAGKEVFMLIRIRRHDNAQRDTSGSVWSNYHDSIYHIKGMLYGQKPGIPHIMRINLINVRLKHWTVCCKNRIMYGNKETHRGRSPRALQFCSEISTGLPTSPAKYPLRSCPPKADRSVLERHRSTAGGR